MRVQTAVRAYVVPDSSVRAREAYIPKNPWRSSAFDQRVLVFDTETSTDFLQSLLFGVFRIYDGEKLELEALIAADDLCEADSDTSRRYAAQRNIRIFSRTDFVETIFYPEVYVQGSLCVGFNLPFDLSRIAIGAGAGRGRHRRSFRLTLSRNAYWPRLRIEAVSGKAAFIGFAPKHKLQDWEKPFFAGRFLDLSTLTRAFTGERHSLRSAGTAFQAHAIKGRTETLGSLTRETVTYARQDVRATWALYLRLKAEYACHPFASFENERERPPNCLPITRIYSSASVAKHYLKLIGLQRDGN